MPTRRSRLVPRLKATSDQVTHSASRNEPVFLIEPNTKRIDPFAVLVIFSRPEFLDLLIAEDEAFTSEREIRRIPINKVDVEDSGR